MTTDIELYSRIQDPIGAIEKLGSIFTKSGLFGATKSEQGMVVALACMAMRKDPFEVMATYHIIDFGGRIQLSMKYDAMLARFRERGGLHKVIRRDAECAEIELLKDGQTNRFSLSWADAQNESFPWTGKYDKNGRPILKPMWATPRGRMQMLWARVVSDAVRTMAPEINFGVHTPEELDGGGDFINAGGANPHASSMGARDTSLLSSGREESKSTAASAAPEQTANGSGPASDPVPPSVDVSSGPVQMMSGPDGKLTADSVKAVMEVIGAENLEDTHKWFVDLGFLKPVAQFSELSVSRAQRVIDNPSGFHNGLAIWRSVQSIDQGGAQ